LVPSPAGRPSAPAQLPAELKPKPPAAPYAEQGAASKLLLEREQQLELLRQMGLLEPVVATQPESSEQRRDVARAASDEPPADAYVDIDDAFKAGDAPAEEALPTFAADESAWERVLRMAASDGQDAEPAAEEDEESGPPGKSRRQRRRLAQEHAAAAAAAATQPADVSPLQTSRQKCRRARVAQALARTREGEGRTGVYFADSAFDWRSLAVRSTELTWSLLGDEPVQAAPSAVAASAAATTAAPAPVPPQARPASPPAAALKPVDLGALGASFARPAASLEPAWQANRDALLDDARRKRRAVAKETAVGRSRGPFRVSAR
jgi:hypothetical protein